MKKMVCVYPGVGSQYVGMSKSLYDNFTTFRETIEEAGDILALDIPGICLSPGKKEELNKLENAQCILLAFSIATYRLYMKEIGVAPDYCMGHSLGEYSALCSAGVISFLDALQLVRQRALIVNEASTGMKGTMMWVINLDSRIVEKVCQEITAKEEANNKPKTKAKENSVYVSAYDTPTQSSISGHTETLLKAARQLEEEGAIVYPLKFSGPFHSPLMKPAAEKMGVILKEQTFEEPQYTVIANHNALPYTGAGSIRENLTQQLVSPIQWRNSIEYLVEQGVGYAIEMGPKNVLAFLMPKITTAIKAYTTDKDQDIQRIKEELIISQNEFTTIIGRCMGVAVSTKNHETNKNTYEEKVVKPYRKIEKLYNTYKGNGKNPEKTEVNEAINTLHTILQAKGIPPQELEYWMGFVFKDKTI
jgi:[acyl-carrier-protein] S-malonyltransferase